jgi:hypothetical protein
MSQSNDQRLEGESFSHLVKYTGTGFVGGLLLAALLDRLGAAKNPLGQWAVRTLAGEGESIFEAIFALRRRISRAAGSMAEAYGWGKFCGMVFPWLVDAISRLLGVNVFAVEGFYIPYFYAMSDQIGASLSGLWFLYRQRGNWIGALQTYARHPVMLASLAVILATPIGLLVARLLGFSPTTQVRAALETIAANLCWLPPVVGWLSERRRRACN